MIYSPIYISIKTTRKGLRSGTSNGYRVNITRVCIYHLKRQEA
nr:MAG TPA: hypothetical protein [Microviridae sp.]